MRKQLGHQTVNIGRCKEAEPKGASQIEYWAVNDLLEAGFNSTGVPAFEDLVTHLLEME